MIRLVEMRFLLQTCVISMVVIVCAMTDNQCLSSIKSADKCQDWKNMSVLVADLVGRSAINVNKVESRYSNLLTLIIRSASGVIGRGADTMKTLVVNGLVLLIRTILTVSKRSKSEDGNISDYKAELVKENRPIDWILNDPYIKSMTEDAVDETLSDRLEKMMSGLPCVQLLACRLSPIVQTMQRRVKDRWSGLHEGPVWNVSDWRRVKETAKYCKEKHYDCAKTV